MTRPTPEEIQAFVDGELSPEDADRVSAAIAADEALARELDEALQVRALAHAMREDRAPASEAHDLGRARSRRRRLLGIAITAPLLAAGVAAYCVARGPREPASGVAGDKVGEELVAALAPQRSVLPRLSWAAADRHRPYDVVRAGSAAGAREPLSFELLARIEGLRDPHALAAANVLIGNVDRARQVLETAEGSAETWSDEAALSLIAGDAEHALLAADRALARAPEHAPALWNRALALAALGLDRTAGEGFERVAARGEPGWSDEARQRAEDLEGRRARREQAYRDALEATSAMIEGGPPAIEQVEVAPGLARLYFYDAVRAAPSAERVRALEPLARALDAKVGGDVLVRHVRKIAGLPFARRAPMAARYAELVRGKLDGGQIQALIRELRGAGPETVDLLLGALLLGGPAGKQVAKEHVAEYGRIAEAAGDPWFAMLAAEQRATAALDEWDVAGAESILRAAAAPCGEPGAIAFRCQRLTRLQAKVYLSMRRAKAAQVAWTHSMAAAVAAGMPPQEDELLWFGGEIATMRDDTSGSLHGLAKAYFEEWALRGGSCERKHEAREIVAQSLIDQNRMEEARRELGGGTGCEPPHSIRRAYLEAQLLRSGDGAGAEALQREVDALRQAAKTAGERAMLDHIEGRARLAVDPEGGRARLRRAIEEARGTESQLAIARAYSYAVLVQEAGQRGAWELALGLLAEERGARPPARCALGASVEGAATFVVRGTDGGLAGAQVPLGEGQDPREVAVPVELQRRLEGCPVVDVYARQPYYGQPALVPALAVRFRARGEVASGPAKGPVVVVGNVVPPGELQLPVLQPIAAPEGAVMIEGAQATPDRVLGAMRKASFVELHTHGLVGVSEDDAALLVLAPDPAGRYALTASEVAHAQLEAHPVVVLAACEAAQVGSSFYAAWGLADAFLEAGASAVIASPSPIRDASAPRFFAGVRARIQRGAGPAEALRDERAAWPEGALRRSLDQLVVFQ